MCSSDLEHSFPAVSPDGKQLVFSAADNLRSNLFVVPLDGGTPRQLTFLDGLNQGAQWSPDGTTVSFGSNASGRPLLMTVPASGGQPTIFSQRTLAEPYFNQWSTDGTRLLYQLQGNRSYGVTNLQTGTESDLVSNESVGWLFDPIFSPDGTKIATLRTMPPSATRSRTSSDWNRRDRGADRGLCVISLEDGSQTAVLTGRIALPISWSADARSIYYVEPDSGGRYSKIWSVSASGGSPTVYADLPLQAYGALTITKDRRRLIVEVRDEESDIWLAEHFDPDVK